VSHLKIHSRLLVCVRVCVCVVDFQVCLVWIGRAPVALLGLYRFQFNCSFHTATRKIEEVSFKEAWR
jgi:hypothetical protein